jgi:hypothetical protein
MPMLPRKNLPERPPFGRVRTDARAQVRRRPSNIQAGQLRRLRVALAQVSDGVADLLRLVESINNADKKLRRQRVDERSEDAGDPAIWRVLDEAIAATEHALRELRSFQAVEQPQDRPREFANRRREADDDEDPMQDPDDAEAGLTRALEQLDEISTMGRKRWMKRQKMEATHAEEAPTKARQSAAQTGAHADHARRSPRAN